MANNLLKVEIFNWITSYLQKICDQTADGYFDLIAKPNGNIIMTVYVPNKINMHSWEWSSLNNFFYTKKSDKWYSFFDALKCYKYMFKDVPEMDIINRLVEAKTLEEMKILIDTNS